MSAASVAGRSDQVRSAVVARPSTMQDAAVGAVTELTPTTFLPLVISRFSSLPRTAMGVQYYGFVGTSTGFDYFEETRAGWVRFPVAWSSIEPSDTTPDNYNWSSLIDQNVLNVTSSGMQVILTLVGQPSWAAEYPGGPPYDNSDLLQFMGAVVERYDGDGISDAPGSPVVRHFELYNEPDNTDPLRATTGGWAYWGNNGTAYAALLKQLYPVIKAASPQAQLVMGGIALDWFEEGGGIFDADFLDDVLSACQGYACFDYANFHYYPVFYQGWAAYGPGIAGKTTYVRQKLAEYGMADIPIVVTELGWVSDPGHWGRSTELQARYAVLGFVRGLSVDLKAMIWFKADDSGLDEDPGLLTEDLEPKLAYEAFKTTSEILSGATFVRALTPADTGVCPIEGYVFSRGEQRIDVVWTTDDDPFDSSNDPVCQYSAWTPSLTVVDKTGNSIMRYDGGDGQLDGAVTIWVGGSPLFLQYP
jgi:hypothetical protein